MMDKWDLFFCLIGLHCWYWITDKKLIKGWEEGHFKCASCQIEKYREAKHIYKENFKGGGTIITHYKWYKTDVEEA